jgi:hypothetical protein
VSPARPPLDAARARSLLGGRAAFAFLTAVLCLFAQVGGAAHLALVSHVRCFEHDALVHAGGAQGQDRAGVTELARLAISGVPVDGAAHADDHCAVVVLRRREDGLATPQAALVAAPVPRETDSALPPRRDDVLVGPVALLRFAPKASPPGQPGRC